MLYIATYGVLLFTIQLYMIISETPSWWLLALWSFLLLGLFSFAKRLSYSRNHPRFLYRQRVCFACAGLLVMLMMSHLYFLVWWHDYQHSELRDILTRQEHGAGDERQAQKLETGDGSEDKPQAQHRLTEETFLVQGRLLTPVEADGSRLRWTMSIESLESLSSPLVRQGLSEPVVITQYADHPEEVEAYEPLNRGDTWRGHVSFSVPVSARNPGAFDYELYLFRQGIQLTATVTDEHWQAERGDGWSSLLRMLDGQRRGWMEQVERIFQPDVAAVVIAMTVGERSLIAPETMRLYQELGIVHLLAISGLHVGVLLWMLYGLGRLLPITRETLYTLLIVFIPVYIYISGAQVSVIRAGLMAMVLLFALRMGWMKQSLLGLYAVYVLILIYDPFFLWDVGFQLSFSITFALLTMVPVVDRILPIRPAFLRTAVSVALIAQLVSLPILLAHFFQFSPYSFFLNVFLVPLYSLVYIPAAFMVTLVSFVHIELVQLAVYVYERSFMWIQDGLRDVHRLSGAVLHTGLPPVWWVCVYVANVCVWLWGMERRQRILVWVPITILPLLVIGLLGLPYMDRHAYITMLDVGQAEAIVVELPYRQEVLLIDAGAEVRFSEEGWQVQTRTFEAGKDVIVPYLRYRGINRIDKVVLSHPHYDHAAGLTAVIDHVDVEAVYRSPTVPQTEWELSFMEELQERDVPVYVLGRGDAWGHDHVSFHVLFPEAEEGLVDYVTNVHDYNIVLYNRIYDTTFLWTGDLEEEGEIEILAEYEQLTADVLKIGHHGSQTSTSFPFLRQLQPVASLVSVGSYNRYGHPHSEVTDRLETEGVPIWRTDQDGGVQIIVGPQGFRVVPTLQGSG